MKELINNLLFFFHSIKRTLMVGTSMLFLSLQGYGQDGELDVDINTNDGGGTVWYTNIWIWIGLALFIIIIVAIVNSGRRR